MRPKPAKLPSQASQLAMLIICSDLHFRSYEGFEGKVGQLSYIDARVRKVAELAFDAFVASHSSGRWQQ